MYWQNFKKTILTLTAALACIPLNACSNDNTENGENGGGNNGTDTDYPATTTVSPKYNSTGVVRNPLNGWVMYNASRELAEPDYWDKTRYVAQLDRTVNIIDYASACYVRTSWTMLNPAEGVYAWRDPSTQIGKVINGALAKGLPIGFRIVVDGRDQGRNTPKWVTDKGAQYWLENSNQPNWVTPYPQDPIFQEHYAKLIEEFARDFDDPEKCAFIDAYGLGKWGEAHNVVYEPVGAVVTANTERLKEEVFEWITDLYTQHFKRVPLLINYHRVIGHPQSEGSPNANSERLLDIAVNKGYSLRHDAFGMNDPTWGYSTWEKAYAAKWAFKRPIVMEGGYVVNSHSYWNDPAGYRQGHVEDVRQGEFDHCKEAGVNMMDFRYGNETYTWFDTSFDLVQKFITEGGYRLYPDQIALPAVVDKGGDVKITHRWRNMGWGYFPNNIPQWNYKYKVAFALLDADGKAKAVYVDTESEPSKWWQNIPVTYDLVTGVELPAGTYKWAVALVDTKDGNKPAINLAVNGTYTADGWLELMDMEVK